MLSSPKFPQGSTSPTAIYPSGTVDLIFALVVALEATVYTNGASTINLNRFVSLISLYNPEFGVEKDIVCNVMDML